MCMVDSEAAWVLRAESPLNVTGLGSTFLRYEHFGCSTNILNFFLRKTLLLYLLGGGARACWKRALSISNSLCALKEEPSTIFACVLFTECASTFRITAGKIIFIVTYAQRRRNFGRRPSNASRVNGGRNMILMDKSWGFKSICVGGGIEQVDTDWFKEESLGSRALLKSRRGRYVIFLLTRESVANVT